MTGHSHDIGTRLRVGGVAWSCEGALSGPNTPAKCESPLEGGGPPVGRHRPGAGPGDGAPAEIQPMLLKLA